MAHPGPPPASDRWNINLPAIIGVVFVFLVVVVIWVITSSGSGDGGTTQVVDSTSPTTSGAPTLTASPTTSPTEVVTATTSPAPMPEIGAVTTTPNSESSSTTTPPTSTTPTPPTTAPGAEPGAVLGDLAIAGQPMQAPPCNGSFITVIASAVGGDASAAGIASVLEAYPDSHYLRTDQTCSSLNPSVDGQPIYVVFFGPYPYASDACAARAKGTPGAYARQLSNDIGPNHTVACDPL